MFDQINGLPVHALVLHAAVIFVPLLALGAIVYALVARWRSKIGWAVLLLGVVAPLSALVTVMSGNELYDRLIGNGMSGPGKEILDDHMGYGTLTLYLSLALGIISIVRVVLTTRRPGGLPKAADLAFAVVMVALSAAALYFVFQAGDSGATAVWGSY